MNLERAVLMMARVELAALQGRYNQGTWGRLEGVRNTNGDIVVDEHGEPIGYGTCGTARCAAGWALHDAGIKMRWWEAHGALYADKTEDDEEVSDAAIRWLGIDPPADRVAMDHPERDDDEFWADFDGDDSRWNYSEDMPHIFDGENTLEDVYRNVMRYLPDVEREDFDDMVMNTIVRLQTEAIEKRVSQ